MRTRTAKLAALLLPMAYLFQTPTTCTVFVDPFRILQGLFYFSNCDVEYDDGFIDEIDCDD